MRDVLLVGGGGFLGAVARYGVGRLLEASAAGARLPIATFVVNVTGCLAIGVLAGLGERTALLTPGARLFLMTGVLGGYTTFSAFALETVSLGRGSAWLPLTLNVLGHVALGILAVLVGYRLAGGTAV